MISCFSTTNPKARRTWRTSSLVSSTAPGASIPSVSTGFLPSSRSSTRGSERFGKCHNKGPKLIHIPPGFKQFRTTSTYLRKFGAVSMKKTVITQSNACLCAVLLYKIRKSDAVIFILLNACVLCPSLALSSSVPGCMSGTLTETNWSFLLTRSWKSYAKGYTLTR